MANYWHFSTEYFPFPQKCGGPHSWEMNIAWSLIFFVRALIPPTSSSYIKKNIYNYSCRNYCKKGSSGLEAPLACLTVSVFNQISQRERGRQLGLSSSCGPFLERPSSYSPLEDSELLREWGENWLLWKTKGHCVIEMVFQAGRTWKSFALRWHM